MVSDLSWEPLQTRRLRGRLNTFFQDHSRHGWTPSGVPSSSTAPADSSRSFSAIPASTAVCRCLQVRLLSKNHPGLECSSSVASGGRVIGGVEAASAISPVTSPHHVYILHELFFCTCFCLSSFMHSFCIARSAIADHYDYRVARHPLEDIATYWTRTRTRSLTIALYDCWARLWKNCENRVDINQPINQSINQEHL